MAGAAIGASLGDAIGAGIGAAVGAAAVAAAEVVTDYGRTPGQPKPQWHRIAIAAFLAAALGGLVDLGAGAFPPTAFTLPFGLLIGIVGTVGLLTFRLNRLLLGLLAGVAVGLPAEILWDDPWLALLAALLALTYRVVGRFWFGGREMIDVIGEGIDPAQVPFVAPYTSDRRRVGADWAERTARDRGWGYSRNPSGIGIVASLDELHGPAFDPAAVAPGIRDFYEHTSAYTLTIVPVWQRRAQPLYWLFKQLIAARIGQANLPFTQAEAQRGVVSVIDPLTTDDARPATLRVWIRSYATSGEPLYVGVYNTYRHHDAGFVSVGFPLPSGNFTATLHPSNGTNGALYLRSFGGDSGHPGHYLSAVEPDGRITVVRIPALSEEIHVYDDDGRLQTDHRFLVWGQTFLNLSYRMHRKEQR